MKTRYFFTLGLTLMAAPAYCAFGDEEHLDVWVQNNSGTITIGGISEDGLEFHPGVRVFGAEFGEDPLFPFLATEPGFQATDGTFDPFEDLQFNLTDAVGVWNGSGFDTSIVETITLAFGPSSVTSGSGFVSGFTFQTDALGGFHDHFDITLNGDGGDPANGVYLLSLNMEFAALGPGGGTGTSDTFWFVMNLGEDELVHDAAIEWVEGNLVPAPGAGFLLLLAGVSRSRRRRA